MDRSPCPRRAAALAFFLTVLTAQTAAVGPDQADPNRADGDSLVLPDSAVYEGETRNGLLHGTGTLTWRNGRRYEGEFRNGLMHGNGVLVDADRSRYEGEFRNGLMHGHGVYVDPQGDRYEGQFKDGIRQGDGVMDFANGEHYEGQFKDGVPHGKGVAEMASGDRYEGEFAHGRMEGVGTYTSRDGTVYAGAFKDGAPNGVGAIEFERGAHYAGQVQDWRMHGRGTYEDEHGNKYTGQFADGQFQGEGKYTTRTGTIYTGRFDNGAPAGEGTIVWTDGRRYEGQIRNWAPHGKGTLYSAGGDVYEGDLVYGDYHGRGTLTLSNGDRYEGQFRKGLFHGEGTFYYATAGDEPEAVPGTWREGRRVSLAAEDGDHADAQGPSPEELLYGQYPLVHEHLDALAASRPGVPDLYFLAFAGYGDQNVFMNEVLYAQELFDQRFGTAGRSLALINHAKLADQVPLATVTNLRAALAGVAADMDRDEDILFMYLTSHGSRRHDLALTLDGVPLQDLSAESLDAALDEAGIKWKVIVVSACYSGGFIEALKDEHTMILTSANAERTSFGCGDRTNFTYFARAFFAHALKETTSFQEAFEQSQDLVARWERREDYTHSRPQIHTTPAIERKLAAWRETLLDIQLAADSDDAQSP